MRVRDPRLLVVVSAAMLGAAIAFPLGVIASHQFTDVPASNTFHDDIAAIRDAGVTTGCGLNLYCPREFVTREQMAAFLNRLGALGPGKTPVVNADKVDGHDDVLPAGDILVDQIGPWAPTFLSPVEVVHQATRTFISLDGSGDGSIELRLQAPGAIGGVVYGLESVEVCYGEPGNTATITLTQIIQVVSVHDAAYPIDDGTDRILGFADCYIVTDASPQAPTGASTLLLQFHVDEVLPGDGAGFALGNIRSTWTPVD